MALLKRLKSIGRDKSGSTLAICAAALPLLIGGAGLAIDSIQISLARRELQRAADSAALAGAYAINQNPTATGTVRATYAEDGAKRDLDLNNDVPITGLPVIENAPTAGNFEGNTNAVRVRLTAHRTLSFLSMFTDGPQAITADATAAVVREGDFCLLALEDGTDPGVTVGGNADIDISCGISTNSRSTTAITATGSSRVKASPVMAVGGVPTSGNFGTATLIPYSAVQTDPFANLPAPTPSNCRDAPDTGGNNPPQTINQNTTGYNATDRSICFNGLNIKGSMTFNFTEPTTVYINGDLEFAAQAAVTSTNATFVVTSTNATSNPSSIGTVQINGGANLNITAPSSGNYAHVAIYMDRRAPVGRTIKWNGGADMKINGALYFPSAYFEYNGNADMANQCIQLVARRLDFRGTGKVRNTCTAGSPTQNFQATYVRLVG